MMQDDREKIFASIRRGLRSAEKLTPRRNPSSPLISKTGPDFVSRFEKFRAELFALGGQAIVAESESEAADALQAELGTSAQVFVYDEIRTDFQAFTTRWSEFSKPALEVNFGAGYDKREVSMFECAITGCAACVAETGSVVLRNDMRLPSALATKLVVLTRPERLIPSLDELFTAGFSNFKGRNMFLVTGPSRTADIEKELVKGVHGPREVLVLFVKH